MAKIKNICFNCNKYWYCEPNCNCQIFCKELKETEKELLKVSLKKDISEYDYDNLSPQTQRNYIYCFKCSRYYLTSYYYVHSCP